MNVSGIEDFSDMFRGTRDLFNAPMPALNLASAVTSVKGMFQESQSFNQNLSGWDVSRVKDMSEIFRESQSFNGKLDG